MGINESDIGSIGSVKSAASAGIVSVVDNVGDSDIANGVVDAIAVVDGEDVTPSTPTEASGQEKQAEEEKKQQEEGKKKQCVPIDVPIYIRYSRVTPRLGSILRPTSDEIDITDSDGSDRDIMTNYKDDVGTHQRYITWWGRIYPRAIFPIDYPRGKPEPWRHIGDKEEPDTSKEPGEDDIDDQDDDAGQQEYGSVGEGDQDDDDEEDGEEENRNEDEEG
ncbi:uncharacterized protein LOC131857830 [Cryptomeria japonica]|uniref:uncharacterized protein LOC131857830 n=1 Tax=Cryptomeria japonica TaxID=3369 RepID=UPI0027DA89DD|nr:uncharacterized protein LOC131857830 [Cryptomeria japonica]